MNGTAAPTHRYRNTKTGRETLFRFVATPQRWRWELLSTDGRIIGEWDKNSRCFRMCNGLSNHVIEKIANDPTEGERNAWTR